MILFLRNKGVIYGRKVEAFVGCGGEAELDRTFFEVACVQFAPVAWLVLLKLNVLLISGCGSGLKMRLENRCRASDRLSFDLKLIVNRIVTAMLLFEVK